jgi:hypothetical protein
MSDGRFEPKIVGFLCNVRRPQGEGRRCRD